MSRDGGCRCVLCVDYGDREHWDDGDRQTIDHVNRFGHSCITVGPTTDDDPPAYVFTTGMWHSHRQPELAIYGVNDFDVMIMALNEIARQAVQRGRPMQAGDRFVGALATNAVAEEDYWVTLMQVHPSWFHSQFGTALHFNRRNDVPFLQAVWPDHSGRRPGDVGFDSYFADRQPQLWLPAADHPPSVWASDETRAIIPGRYRRRLADAIAGWEHGQVDATKGLDYAVGITLNWLHGCNESVLALLPHGVEYRASKASVARPARGDDLCAAGRELLI